MGFGSFTKSLGSLGKSIGSFLGPIGDAAQIAAPFISQMTEPPASSQLGFQQATQGVRWRVADAKAAGLHPLAVLGANIPGGFGTSSGTGLGDAIGRSGAAMSRASQRRSQARADAREDAEASSRIRVNETQAELNRAQSRTILSKIRGSPTITSMQLDPLDTSYHIDPTTGRLTGFKGADGRWYDVDQSVAPQSVLEEEFGEAGELQGIARLLHGASKWKGLPGYEGPSLSDLYDIITGR